MNDRDRSGHGADLASALGIVSGLKGFMVWLGGSLAGLTAILYVCGYLITTAHIYTLGLYGLVDFSKDYFLLEGSKFVLSVVVGLAQIVISPVAILLLAMLAPLALIAILARAPLLRRWQALRAMYATRVKATWATAARFVVYCTLVISAAMIAFESLRAISFHLQMADLLYSRIDPGRCGSDWLQVREAYLCGEFGQLREAFNQQLWAALRLVAITCIAWAVVARWPDRAWLISPLVFASALLVLMLPMEFGALLRPTRYPLVLVETRADGPPVAATARFLIDRNDRGLTLWDPGSRRVFWIPSGDIVRMETLAVRELFANAAPPSTRLDRRPP